MVLLNVPARDLLASQRVKSIWRDLTKTSPALQRKLFYKADLASFENSTSDIQWNPLARILTKEPHIIVYGKALDAKLLGQMDYPGATWKDMYLTQPTTNRVSMIVHDREGPKKNHPLRIIAEGMVNNPSGIKMGQLREIDWFTPRHRLISDLPSSTNHQ